VHNAGIFDVGTVADIDEQAWDRLVSSSSQGAYPLSKAVIPLIGEVGGSVIVHIASHARQRGRGD